VWRGDSHYGRVEAMEWAETTRRLYFWPRRQCRTRRLRAEVADNLRFHHAMSSKAKLRTFACFTYQAGSWKRPRKVVARLECSLQLSTERPACARRSTSLRRHLAQRLGAAPLRERLLPSRQMENLIKLHKAQLASDRMSCHSATANQVRLVLHTAAFWLMHGVRAAIPQTSRLRRLSSQRSGSA